MAMPELFVVSMRTALTGEMITPEYHNEKLDAVKEALSIAKDTMDYIFEEYSIS